MSREYHGGRQIGSRQSSTPGSQAGLGVAYFCASITSPNGWGSLQKWYHQNKCSRHARQNGNRSEWVWSSSTEPIAEGGRKLHVEVGSSPVPTTVTAEYQLEGEGMVVLIPYMYLPPAWQVETVLVQ